MPSSQRPAPKNSPLAPGKKFLHASHRDPHSKPMELDRFQGRVVVDLAEEGVHVGDGSVGQRPAQRPGAPNQVDRLVDPADPVASRMARAIDRES